MEESELTITKLGKELNVREGGDILGKERELIGLVKQYPYLYDRSAPDFKDTQKKNEAWETIARIFGVSVGQTQTKWKNMRDHFNRSRKSAEDSDGKVACPYYDDMKFLEPFILTRRVFGPMRISTVQLTDEDSDETPSNENSKDLSDTQKIVLDDTIQFIKAVKSLPVLYQHKYSTIRHKTSRITQWKQLAKSLGISVQVCLDRWKILRDRYSRERKIMDDGKIDSKWRLFDELNFLDPHIRRRRTYLTGRISCMSESRSDSTDQTESTEIVLLDTDFLSDDVLLPKSEQIENVEFFDVSNIQEFTEDSLASNDYKRRVSNEDDLFGQTIAAELRQINCSKKKLKLKADIYQLLYKTCCN